MNLIEEFSSFMPLCMFKSQKNKQKTLKHENFMKFGYHLQRKISGRNVCECLGNTTICQYYKLSEYIFVSEIFVNIPNVILSNVIAKELSKVCILKIIAISSTLPQFEYDSFDYLPEYCAKSFIIKYQKIHIFGV